MPPPGYCPECGTEMEARALEGRTRAVCPACGHIAWGNARPCAGALVLHNGKVLLVRRAVDPFRGEWDIPGGFCEQDEHPAQTAIREVREETGLEIELTALFGLWMDEYEGRYTLNVYYLARPVGGILRPCDDADGAAWFDPGALPPRIAFENGREVLRAWAGGTGTPLHLRGLVAPSPQTE